MGQNNECRHNDGDTAQIHGGSRAHNIRDTTRSWLNVWPHIWSPSQTIQTFKSWKRVKQSIVNALIIYSKYLQMIVLKKRLSN